MQNKEIEKVNSYYDELLEKHGVSASALGCPKGRQELRFKNIDRLIFSECSILDYGCGLADLYKYLNLKFPEVNFKYSGCDIVPKFLDISKKLYPEIKFTNIAEEEIKNTFDITAAFGVFNFLYTKNEREHFNIVKTKLEDIFSITNKYLLVDFQSHFVDYKQGDSYHQDIETLIDFVVNNLSRRFEIIHSYMPYEYSLIIYKESEIFKSDNTFLNK